MEKKSFMEYIPKESNSIEAVVQPIKKEKKIVKESPAVDRSFKDELFSKEIKEEVYKKEKSLIESKIRVELEEQFNQKAQEFKLELTEKMNESIASMFGKNNEALLNVISGLIDSNTKLCERIEALQTSLNINIPTPVVQVTMPDRKVVRKVHRDSNNNISHITEESED
jgi:hypothetical protein